MKTIFITCSIFLIAAMASAQNQNSAVPNLSSKELMKLQVMKMNPQQGGYAYQNASIVSNNISKKEQMKMEVTGLSMTGIFPMSFNNLRSCPSCIIFSNLAAKEKMKTRLAGTYKCATGNIAGCENIKCRFCIKS